MLVEIYNTLDNSEEYVEIGKSFRILPNSLENLSDLLERWPKAISFIVSDNITIPVLQDLHYIIKGENGNIIKTI